jgi:hypothetical protein
MKDKIIDAVGWFSVGVMLTATVALGLHDRAKRQWHTVGQIRIQYDRRDGRVIALANQFGEMISNITIRTISKDGRTSTEIQTK